MRKEVKEIVSANSKEGENEGNITSTEDLLNKLIDITEKQNNLLERNNSNSEKFNFLLLIISSISFLAAFASTQIAALQLQASDDLTGMGIFYFLCIVVAILEIMAWIAFFCPKKIEKST